MLMGRHPRRVLWTCELVAPTSVVPMPWAIDAPPVSSRPQR